MDSVEVGGLRIADERAGAGPPLVLLANLEALEAFDQAVRAFLDA